MKKRNSDNFLQKLLTEKMQQNVKGSAEIVYHGKTLPIKNEKTLLAMQKIEELTKVISKMDTDKMELDEESGEPNKLSNILLI